MILKEFKSDGFYAILQDRQGGFSVKDNSMGYFREKQEPFTTYSEALKYFNNAVYRIQKKEL